VNLITSSTHEKDILVVRAVDLPLSEIMEKIAIATSSEWQLKSGAYRLVRTAATEKKEDQAEFQQRVTGLKRSYARLVEKSNPKPPVQLQELGLGSAGQRIIPELLVGTDMKELAGIEEDDRLVLSTSPNSMQRPLGRTLEQVMELLASNYNKYKTGQQRVQTVKSLLALLDTAGVPTDQPEKANRQPKAILSVWRAGTGYYIWLKFYNSRGKAVWPCMAVLYDDGLEHVPGPKATYPEATGPNQEIKLSADSQEISSQFGDGPPQGLSERTSEKLLKPDLYEPLGFEVSDCLLQVAQCKQLNLIANLPDDLSSVFKVWGWDRPKTVNRYLGELTAQTYLRVATDGEWLSILPAKPALTRRLRLDRSSLARLLQSCAGTGNARLAPMSEFVSANEIRWSSNVAIPYFLMYCPNAMGMGDAMSTHDMLSFYATLSGSQRRDFDEGSEIPFRSMTPEQRRLASKIAFGGNRPLIDVAAPPPGIAGSGGPPLQVIQNWKLEPTEVMPNGLPGDGSLRATISEMTVGIYTGSKVKFAGSGSHAASGFTDIDKARVENPKWKDDFKLRLGSRRSYDCNFLLAPDVISKAWLTDDFYEPSGKAKSWDELPDSFRADIEQAIEVNRKRREEYEKNRPKPPPSY
jgi:hypothetical protein